MASIVSHRRSVLPASSPGSRTPAALARTPKSSHVGRRALTTAQAELDSSEKHCPQQQQQQQQSRSVEQQKTTRRSLLVAAAAAAALACSFPTGLPPFDSLLQSLTAAEAQDFGGSRINLPPVNQSNTFELRNSGRGVLELGINGEFSTVGPGRSIRKQLTSPEPALAQVKVDGLIQATEVFDFKSGRWGASASCSSSSSCSIR